MHYKLIVNQPFQSTVNVLAAAFRFVCAYAPHLLRLEEHWRVIPNGIAIHDSFNNQDLPFGREATMEEWESESDANFIIPFLTHGCAACHKAIFDEPGEELNAVRKKLIETLRSLSVPQTNIYMLVFKDSADTDILYIFANLGYPEAMEELEFRWSLR